MTSSLNQEPSLLTICIKRKPCLFCGIEMCCSGVSMTADDHDEPINPVIRHGILFPSAVIDTPLQCDSYF